MQTKSDTPRSLARRIFRGFVVLAIFGFLGIAALLGSLWLEHNTQIKLPTPTGPSAVGRTIYVWADDKTMDVLAPVPGTKRELLVWFWYPAVTQSGVVVDDYMPASVRAPVGRTRGQLGFRILSGVFALLSRDLLGGLHHRYDRAAKLIQRCAAQARLDFRPLYMGCCRRGPCTPAGILGPSLPL